MMRKTTAGLAAGLVPGTVGLIGATADGGLLPVVAITRSSGGVVVVPVSSAVHYATEWDLELPADVLGYRAIAEVWNYGTVLPEQCSEIVATVTEPILAGLRQLASAAVSGRRAPEGLPVGPPVLDDQDPRLLFQDDEADLAHPFWEPALTLAGAATFGEVVRHRREELNVAPAELEASASASGWLSGIEDDVLDLRQVLPPRALVDVLRRLQIGASSRLREIVSSTLQGSSPQLARGASGENPLMPDADTYLDEVFSELQKDSE